ncbi:helix-turn-helix domain-containing protein [Oceanobacillus luteolus]|uniref:Helix-turn-helix domain-containing protein n=1 Tax=Oceanobacillus luteolus TaxID=1274358 RepID=A0ABW4HQX4_9BACI|nr:helix-turn-helix domain-containing protein [Oceanobacillus luteolus]MCM3738981.1 helix-turn-helix domain-containing protein [Oceanobacillus luteolus]
MDVGARLKEARIAKGLSLESVQETTKIQKRYLVAIEEGNLHLLPGKFYARAFIKEYASAVGIDSDELLEEHKEEIPKSESDSEIQYTRVERAQRENSAERSNTFFSLLPKIIVVLLIVGIIGAGIWFYNQASSSDEPEKIEESDTVIITDDNNTQDNGESAVGDDENSDDTAEETDEESTTEEDSKDEEGQEVVIEVEEVGTGSTPESTISLTNPNDELIFTFESSTNVWLDVKNTAGEAFFADFVTTANSPVEVDLTGEEAIYLNIGSTPNLEIDINGVPFEYPVDPNERDHQRLWFNVN